MPNIFEEKYNPATIISQTLYNGFLSVASGLWWFTKETTKETIKISVPILTTLYLANKYDLIQVKTQVRVKIPIHNKIKE